MTANEALDRYLSGLPPRIRVAKSRDLRLIGGIESYTLSAWRRGKVRIPAPWRDKISEIFGENVFENVDM